MAKKPENINPFAQYVEQSKEAVNPFEQYVQDRTLGEAFVTDPITSLLKGTGSVISIPGQLSSLLTGKKASEEKAKGTTKSLLDTILPFGSTPSEMPEKVLEKVTPQAATLEGVAQAAINPFAGMEDTGEELKAFGKKFQSTGSTNSEKDLARRINEANGFFDEAGVAIGGTLTNPALMSDFIFSQMPNFAVTMGGGVVTQGIVKTFLKDATTKTLNTAGVSGAIATGAAMQAADIGSDTYETIYQRLVKEGMDKNQAHEVALEKARIAGSQAAAVSVASSFIPGGKALEKRFLTEAGKKAGKTTAATKVGNVIGETLQESSEEGLGKLASNVQVQSVFPETDIMKGVGAASGQGALGGGMFGGLSNLPSRNPAADIEKALGIKPVGESIAGAPTKIGESEIEDGTSTFTPPVIDGDKQIPPELKARAIMRFEQLFADATEEKPFNIREMNKLARELDIEPSKDRNETAAAISKLLFGLEKPVSLRQPIQQATTIEANPELVALQQEYDALNARLMAGDVSADEFTEVNDRLADIQSQLKQTSRQDSSAPQATEVLDEEVIAPKTREATTPEDFAVIQDAVDKLNIDVKKPVEPAPVVQETEEVVTAAPVVAEVPAVEEPKELVGAEKKIDDLIKNKDSIVKQMAENYKISPEYAAKAYDAELEYTRAASRAYEDHPNPISEKDFKAAINKHDTFFNKLKGVSSRAKEKETAAPAEVKKTQAEINRERQADKKAAAVDATEEKMVDAIQGMAYKKNGMAARVSANDFIAKFGKKMFDDAVKADLLDNEPGEGRLFPSNNYVYKVVQKYYDGKGNKIKAAKETKPKAEAKVEDKPKAEEVFSPEVTASIKEIEFQNRLIKANKEKTITEPQFSKLFKLLQDGKITQADEQLTKMLAKNDKKTKVEEEPEDIPKVEIEESKKVSTEGGVPALIDKFKGSFFGKPTEVSEEVYDQAAKEFLEGPLTAKVPTGKMDSINPVRLQDVSPQPIEKKINPVAKTFADLTKVLYQIAAKEDIRFYLKGVNVEKAKKRLVVTDGHRMAAINDISLKDVPKAEGNATVYTKDNKYIDAQYPDVDRVLPTKHAKNKVTIDVAPLGDYARGANKSWRYISSRMAAPVPLIIGESTYAFNAKYIEDMSNLFRQLGYDTAEVSLADGKLYATSPDGKVQQVVMSMREDRPLYSKYALERNMVISGEGLIREITPEDRKLLTNSTKELSDAETSKLEKVYGSKRDSDDFLQKLRDDATKYINDGANSIEKAIRSIIAKVAAAMLSVAIVFNPNFMSDASAVVIPQQAVEVRAEVPKDAAGMSAAGKKAYATLYPALQAGLQKNNKFFTVVDKPTSQMFVFNPDGSMLLKSNVLLGSQFGDNYVGQTDFKENRMTPAGLFKPKAEKGSVTYDGKTVYTFGNLKEGWNAVFMHSVYLKAGDADARQKGLATGDRTRLSYGCINGPENVMERLDNSSMDESHVFIVPDNQAAVDDYITNKVSNEDLTRETVTPVTKKVPVPQSTDKKKQDVIAREEEADKPPRTQAELNQDRQQAKRASLLKAEKPYYGNFTNNIDETKIGKMRQDIKKELSDSSRQVKTSLTKILRTLAKGQAGIRTQREATELLEARTELNRDKKFARIEIKSADWFLRSAITDAEMHRTYPRDDKYGLEPEVLDVIKDVHAKFPKLLEGLKLSIKKSEGDGTAGNFGPFSRLVTLYKDTSGTSDPKTFRHEIMHSVEQMMPDDVYQIVIDNWAKSLGKAIEKHKDKAHQTYFERVLDFTNNPTDENYRKALAVLPSYEMYQYINPSEFWAVNAEKLFASKLGGRWENFKRAVSKVFESIKNIFGFENRYGVHKAFDQLFKGSLERGENKRMLVDYLFRNNNKEEFTFLNNIDDYLRKREEDGRPQAPNKPSRSVKDRLLGGFKEAKRVWTQVINNKTLPATNIGGKLSRTLTYLRVTNIWYAKGLEIAEARKYQGQLRKSDQTAIASVAVTNALHAGHIASEVILRGKLIFNEATQMFQAVRDKFSMANVLAAKHDLIERVGLDTANNLIQDYFEAKRSRSIVNEFLQREGDLAKLEEKFEAAVEQDERSSLRKQIVEAEKDLFEINKARKKVNLTDEQIDFYSDLEKEHPELRTMMNNWTAVNKNMIDSMEMSNLISKKRADQLRDIEDYVPWYRIQENMAEIHTPVGPARSLTDVAQEKRFSDSETDLDIDDIVDNMLHNVMVTTRNSARNHAANQVAMSYATRNDKGKIVTFSDERPGPNGEIRTNVVINGKRVIIEIKDPLIAQSVLGMESVAIPGMELFGMISNNLRRGITLWPQFQLKQLFMDAPTAALVSGVKDPHKVWAGTFKSFLQQLTVGDPIVDNLKSYGIGGYQSVDRSPEDNYKRKIGLLEGSKLDYLLEKLDQVGDSSDYAQRVSIYKRVLAETGDELQALMQANNVIDFMKHGSGRVAQYLSRTVSFMNAYAQQIDVLAESLAGGGLKGKDRKAALLQLAKTGSMLAFYSMLYTFAIGDDEEYQKLDDQTKVRNFFVPKRLTKYIGMDNALLIPMNTSASFFFKSFPELLINAVVTQGTNNANDRTRVMGALGTAALDSLLGPNPIPSAVKPVVEIVFNRNFLTGGAVTPQGLKGLEASEQYNAATSELGKALSAASGGLINPIQADHLMRGLFGTTGAAVMWGSNMFNGERATSEARSNPMYGGMVAADVARGPEDLLYKLKEKAEEADKTFNKLHERGRHSEADKYFDKNEKLIKAAGYTKDIGTSIQEINKEIRRLGEQSGTGLSADQKRERIRQLQTLKSDMLSDIALYRKQAGL